MRSFHSANLRQSEVLTGTSRISTSLDLPIQAAGIRALHVGMTVRAAFVCSAHGMIPRAVNLQFVYNESMAAETTTVRVRRPDSERLQSLAKARQTAVIDVVHAAIDALERQEFLRGLNGDYQRLRSDPELWEQYLAERREWDALA